MKNDSHSSRIHPSRQFWMNERYTKVSFANSCASLLSL